MREIGCTELSIAAVKCFKRPPDAEMSYRDWIYYMKRHPLTRKVKAADGLRAQHDFVAQSENQANSWSNAHAWLTSEEREDPEMTARINERIVTLNLPDLPKLFPPHPEK